MVCSNRFSEEYDDSLESAVKREIKEETNLDVKSIESLPLVFEYESLNKTCLEYCFISNVSKDNIILNEENIDYNWCNLLEFIDLIKWYYDKEELKEILSKYLDVM